MSGRQKRPGSPGSAPPTHYRAVDSRSSCRALPSSASGRHALSPAVSTALSGVPTSPSVPTLSPIRPTAGDATFVVSPELLAAIEMEHLLIPDLPSSLIEVGAFLIHWAVDSKEGWFHITEAVMCAPLL